VGPWGNNVFIKGVAWLPPPPKALKEYLQMLEDDWKDFDSKLKRSFGLL